MEEAIRQIPEIVSCHYISGAGTFELQVVSQRPGQLLAVRAQGADQPAEREGHPHQLLAGRGEGEPQLAAVAPAAPDSDAARAASARCHQCFTARSYARALPCPSNPREKSKERHVLFDRPVPGRIDGRARNCQRRARPDDRRRPRPGADAAPHAAARRCRRPMAAASAAAQLTACGGGGGDGGTAPPAPRRSATTSTFMGFRLPSDGRTGLSSPTGYTATVIYAPGDPSTG